MSMILGTTEPPYVLRVKMYFEPGKEPATLDIGTCTVNHSRHKTKAEVIEAYKTFNANNPTDTIAFAGKFTRAGNLVRIYPAKPVK